MSTDIGDVRLDAIGKEIELVRNGAITTRWEEVLALGVRRQVKGAEDGLQR